MNKTESLILKGVAILLMLYLHLFNQMQNVDLCSSLLYIGNLPLVFLLSRATNPVPFFLILSGYGLYTVIRKNSQYNILRKMRRLYIHYWITLSIFVPLGAWIVGCDRYPGSIITIIKNVTAWHTTWNGEIWFLFPYLLLALTSKVIFIIMSHVRPQLYFGSTLLISLCMSFCISRYGTTYLYNNHLLHMPVMFFSLLFTFSLGAAIAKYNIVEKVKLGGGISLALLLLIVTIRCCFSTSAFHSFYAFAFVLLFLRLNRPSWLDNFLKEMGRRATSMWFIHTYFAYYLFHDFIYSFKQPIAVYLVLLLCSYLCALLIDQINKRVINLLKF